MLLLTAVNEILPKLGEHPVTSLESKSPTLGVILPQIDSEIRSLLLGDWWFNTFEVDLFPNSEGEIDVPEGTMSFVSNRGQTMLVERGEKFYNAKNRSYKFTDAKVSGRLKQSMDFEELPQAAAQYVLKSALVTIYVTDIGLEQVVTVWQQDAMGAMAVLEGENLRQKRYTIKQSRRYRNLRNAMRG